MPHEAMNILMSLVSVCSLKSIHSGVELWVTDMCILTFVNTESFKEVVSTLHFYLLHMKVLLAIPVNVIFKYKTLSGYVVVFH